ncbi:MAG: 4-diphosphocytidyl-2-C-methyl-D-erythritol kinase [Flavobacteriales bacterium]|jgi:4-diphosphocytidyl-2-C-methyl-D-erythritol kinase
MIVFPNAKINIGLQVVSKRPDGYHDLASVFYPVPLKDSLEFIPSKQKGLNLITDTNLELGKNDDNLITKAYNLLAKSHTLPDLDCHLIKAIPMGAGLGGGSSDATFALCAINKIASLNISKNKLKDLALELGSDCSFFIDNVPSLANGRGEILTPLPSFLARKFVVIVSPKLHISTHQAFNGITPSSKNFDLTQIAQTPQESWRENIVNDFEANAFRLHPELDRIKSTLHELGAFYASMTGTGSSIYGLFNEAPYGQMLRLGIGEHPLVILEL